MEMSIRFPGIDLVLPYVPRSFRIFGMEFTIYGMLIAAGALLGMGLVILEAKRNQEDQNRYLNLMLISLAASVAGSRLFYVIFSWSLYSENPGGIFAIRNGGYMFYGGLLAAVIAAAVFCKYHSLSFLKMADTVTPGILLGQAVGRWGNFFNRESFGEYTDWITAMQIPISAVRSGEVSGSMRENLLTIDGISYIQVHPVFLYESLWCLLLLLLLSAARRRKRFEGELFMRYLAGYGLGRFFFEWLRTDKLCIPGTKMGVSLIISAALFLIFTPSVIIQRVMAKKRADIRRISRERAYQEEKRFRSAAERKRRKNEDTSVKNKEQNTKEQDTEAQNAGAQDIKAQDMRRQNIKTQDIQKQDSSISKVQNDQNLEENQKSIPEQQEHAVAFQDEKNDQNNWEDLECAHISKELRSGRYHSGENSEKKKDTAGEIKTEKINAEKTDTTDMEKNTEKTDTEKSS